MIQSGLKDTVFARNIVFRQVVDSTNTLAKTLAAEGSDEGTLVLAEEQTAGRGRMGRQWLSPAYHNLMVSILLRPEIPANHVFVLTMILALAVSEGVEDMVGLKPFVKWPNDLYVGGEKIAGILTEFATRDKRVEYVILGMGLNVNWSPGNEAIGLYPTTSIMAQAGAWVSRGDLLVRILRVFHGYYEKFRGGDVEDIYRRWNSRSLLKDKDVEILSGDATIRGRAKRIDRDGALIIDCSGEERRIVSGDVSVIF